MRVVPERLVTFPTGTVGPRVVGLVRRKRPSARSMLVVALVLVIVAVGVVKALLLTWLHTGQLADEARTAAHAQAGPAVEQILSYHSSSIDADLARARSLTTGGFQSEFTRLSESVVSPAARADAVDTDARAVAVSVVSAEPERAVALVFVDQQTKSSTIPVPRIDQARVEITLDKVDKKWLVSNFVTL